MNQFIKYIYGFLIMIAIFTTAISSGYGFLKNISCSKRVYFNLSFSICLFAIFLGNLSFSSLIKVFYPFFGVLGILQIFFLVFA